MKILHVITSLRTGGAEKLMVDLLPRIQDSSVNRDVELLVFDGLHTRFYEELERKGVRIHSFGEKCNVYNPLFVVKLIPLIRQFDVVHTHNTACQMFVALANVFVGTRIITTEHNTYNRRRNHWWMKGIDRWMYSRYEKIICISDKARENLTRYIGCSDKIITIYNGVDTERFCNAIVKSKQSSNVRIITMVAAFREQKDHKTLIEALELLPENYHLNLVGDGELRTETEAWAMTSECRERIVFMGNRSDVPEILKGSDVVVLSSHYEGMPLAAIEGMACGKPFVASDVDGLHEVVNGYGVLFPHGDTQVLANEIRKCCEDNDYAATVVERCQKRAKMFDISMMVQGYMAVYERR